MSDNASEIFNNFKNAWEEQINKIENQVLDKQAVINIYNFFQNNKQDLLKIATVENLVLSKEMYQEIYLIDSKLVVALEITRTRYSLQNKAIWARITDMFTRFIPKSTEIKF
jgi:hypothetical protein